jgi:hypothetical protein
MRRILHILVAGIALALGGCNCHPFGLSPEEWEPLSKVFYRAPPRPRLTAKEWEEFDRLKANQRPAP